VKPVKKLLYLPPRLIYLLGDPKDPVTVWNKLGSTFQKKTFANKLRLKKMLYTKRLMAGGSIQKHLKEFIELFDELAVVGSPIEEEDRVISLLASLPESYSTLVTALEAQDSVPSWETVMEKLVNEERKNTEISPVTESKGFVAKNSNKQKLKCHECGKVGHFRKKLLCL